MCIRDSGITTRFNATLTEDGQTRDVVPLPTQTLAVLEIPTFGLRRGLNAHCDAGGQLGIGQLAGEARCGVGSDGATAAVATSVQYLWWSGLVGRADVQVGLAKAGWLMFASTGISYGWLRYK